MQAQSISIPTLSSLTEWLKRKGWEKLPPSEAVLNYCDHLWHKKTGIVSINLYNYSAFQSTERSPEQQSTSFALEVAATSQDGYFTRYEKYGIHEHELKEVLDSQVETLINAWIAINGV